MIHVHLTATAWNTLTEDHALWLRLLRNSTLFTAVLRCNWLFIRTLMKSHIATRLPVPVCLLLLDTPSLSLEFHYTAPLPERLKSLCSTNCCHSGAALNKQINPAGKVSWRLSVKQSKSFSLNTKLQPTITVFKCVLLHIQTSSCTKYKPSFYGGALWKVLGNQLYCKS